MKRLPIKEETKLVRWLKDKLKSTTDKVKVLSVRQGGFYTFKYQSKLYNQTDSKGKRKLEFYDEQPLVLMLGKGGGYLLGLNFHYLPPDIREKVLDRLKSRYKKQFNKNKLLPNVSWSNVSKELKYSDFMVKLYIGKNISSISRIDNTDMEKTIQIPSEKFIGVNSKQVWKNLGL